MELEQRLAKLKRLSNHAVHHLARLYVVAEAALHELRAEMEPTRPLLTVNGVAAQVFSRRAGGAWQVSKDPPFEEETKYVIFVDLGCSPPDFFVAPADVVAEGVKARWDELKSRHGGQRPRNPHSKHGAIERKRIEQWHDRWDQFE
jgi:hypothetical protein